MAARAAAAALAANLSGEGAIPNIQNQINLQSGDRNMGLGAVDRSGKSFNVDEIFVHSCYILNFYYCNFVTACCKIYLV